MQTINDINNPTFVSGFPNMQSASARLHQRACAVMPGGNTRHTTVLQPYPIYAASGKGCYIRDIDGVERLDFINNASALIHGHSRPEVVEAIVRQAQQLVSTTMPTEHEIELAEILCERVTSVEQVRFGNSGTEAVMFAVMAARAYTGRDKVAKVEGCYHGGADFLAVSLTPSPASWGEIDAPNSVLMPGTPGHVAEDIVILPLDNIERVQSILEQHKQDLAAVMVNPIMTQLGHNTLSDDLLAMFRAFTRNNGSLLICDEVYSFRLGYGGAQGKRRLDADLTTFGKVIGGGLPIGAFGGKREIMDSLFNGTNGKPVLQHSGTFCGNPMSMAAGCAAMKLLTPAAFERLDQLGDRARAQLIEALQIAGVAGQVKGEGSVLSVLLCDREITDYRSLAQAKIDDPRFVERAETFYQLMLNECVVIGRWGNMVLSTAMTEKDIDYMTEAALRTLQKIRSLF